MLTASSPGHQEEDHNPAWQSHKLFFGTPLLVGLMMEASWKNIPEMDIPVKLLAK